MGRRPWSYDEIVLACDLVVSNDWQALDRTDRRVAELSQLLRRPEIPERGRCWPQDTRHRDAASGLPRRADEGWPGHRPRGWVFLAEPERMRRYASEIKATALGAP
jgi:5-methylcytosine-specific restriction protein A